MSEAHMFFFVQLQPLAMVCYHKLYIIFIFVSKIVMNLYNCLQFRIKYLPTYLTNSYTHANKRNK